MSLLLTVPSEESVLIAKEIFDLQFRKDPFLSKEYDERQKRLMYEDILYNLGYMDTALFFNDPKIFTEYTKWILQLLFYAMKNISHDRIREQMVVHYELLCGGLKKILPTNRAELAESIILESIQITKEHKPGVIDMKYMHGGQHTDLKNEYLMKMMDNKTHEAIRVIANAHENNTPIGDIYDDILRNVMYEVGDLWYRKAITVDKEHYCTSTTQVALSQFYPIIFSTPRNGLKILTSCIGSELHEMGIRILSDLFEYKGWDSVYLGSAVPKESIISAIKEHKPEVVGLSVTMPQHLKNCYEVVMAIRNEFGNSVKIIVGGRAFSSTNMLWTKWDIDYYAKDAQGALDWADKNF